MPNTSTRSIAALTAAAEGLLVPSEQDATLELFQWQQREQLTPARLCYGLLIRHSPAGQQCGTSSVQRLKLGQG